MGLFTSFMVSLAEISQVASISAILVLFSLMLGYILRLFSLDLLNGFPGGVVRVTGSNHIPRINMERKNLNWTVKVMKHEDRRLQLEFKLSETVEILIFRAYWGVNINAFYHVLRSPWDWFIQAFKNGNLFGSENCLKLDSMQEHAVLGENTLNFNFECSQLDLGSEKPRTKFPLVLVSTVNTSTDDQYFNLHIIHLGDDMLFKTHILNHWIKWPEPKVTRIESTFNEELCVICINAKASRVTLPCKHANLCRPCFAKLPQKKCPMCRTIIQSYFLIETEDEDDNNVENEINIIGEIPMTWRQRLADLEHRFAMAVGLQEND